MRKIILLCASLFTMVLSFSVGPVRAQLWVSPNGSDSNGCSEIAPCLSFQRAINLGASQINCLSSGNYGTITIAGSLTIDCGTGNVGNIVNSNGTAITISTTSAATIILRHLALNGLSAIGYDGIRANSFFSGTLIVEDCMISGYSGGFGIDFSPTNGRGLLQVSNSQIFSNANGIFVSPTTNQIASVTLNKVEVVGNAGDGLFLGGNGIVAGTMRDSVVGENGQVGVIANASQVFFTVEESSVVDNLGVGIETASAGSVVNVGASTIGGNGAGVLPASGSLISFGNNQMSANGTNGNFTSTTALR